MTWEWFDIKWFTPEVLKNFDWSYPVFLYGIAFIPVIYLIKWAWQYKFRQKLDIALPENRLKSDLTALLRFIPILFQMLVMALLLVAMARPQQTNEQVEQWTEGIDIMLVLDISLSMKSQDFEPNRLEAAKDVAKNFINGRFQDRIGLVVFSGDAISYAPLTTDYDLLLELTEGINFDMIETSGTAIGSALAVATNRMRDSDSKSKVIILLSDGENTAGSIDPETAARLAYAYNIKLYTIGVGKDGKVPYGKDAFGRPIYVNVKLEEGSLREIAKIGKGQYFRATNNKALEMIFKRIDEYEKAEIKETRYRDTNDFYQHYLTWALLFFLLWLATKSSFLTNALED